MIKKIKLNGFASYRELVEIDTNQKLNFFYGLNGTGKTAMSEFLNDRKNSKYHPSYLECNNQDEIFVYNSNFVHNNFYDKDTLKGVFTIGEANKEAEQAIQKASVKIEELRKEVTINEEAEMDRDKNNKKLKELIEDKFWTIIDKYKRTDLNPCLDGYKGSKNKLFEKMLEDDKELDLDKTINNLQEEARQYLSSVAAERPLVEKLVLEIESIEVNPIFQEPITGTDESVLSELIARLNNSDWVKQGISHLEESHGKCPFCQQSIDEDLSNHIKGYFDKKFKINIEKIENIKSSYQEQSNRINIYQNKEFLFVEEYDILEILIKNLTNKMADNILLIERKINFPNERITLKRTDKEIDKVNKQIQEINTKLNGYNQKIKDKKKARSEIIIQFWKLMKIEFKADINTYRMRKSDLDNQIAEIRKQNASLIIEIDQQNKIISKNQGKSGIERSIKNINTGLKNLALEGFQIEKYEINSYRIKRDNEPDNDNKFRSLSEGEKTLISFLYFLEVCRGTEVSGNQVNLENRIIVIDDPISSLSHNYIFDMAQIIKVEFFKKHFQQIFILSHSIYFLSEVIKTNGNKNLFRIEKNKKTTIQPMKPEEILDTYRAYWQVLKTYQKNPSFVSNVLLGNTMRNILECLRGFIHADMNFRATNKNLEKDYPVFTRYINRESHFDSVNSPFDVGEIEGRRFMEAFKKIFKGMRLEDHYNKMMEE